MTGPRAESLSNQIAAFFRRNPEEWLSYSDMATKFDTTEEAAQKACDYLVIRYGLKRETMRLVRIAPGEGEAP